MLLDPRPKTSRNDLFDREKELNELHNTIEKKMPIVALTGVRRIGKTSLLRVFLNEIDLPHILIDARELPPNYGLRDLYSLISSGMSNKTFIEKMRNILKAVKGLRIMGFEVELSWKGRESLLLPVLFDYLNKERIIIAVDEAQGLRGPRGTIFLDTLAHAYDYDDNLSFILTGSEAGLLLDYLGIENPSSPLYGRSIKMITIERFTKDQSIEFLKQGFKEAGVTIPIKYIESITELFDGIPGWLTLAGNTIINKSGKIDLEKIKTQAIEIARKELQGIANSRGKRYALILKSIAQGFNTWSKLKHRLEELEGKTVPKSALYNALETLEKLSIIKNYEFLDPVYKEAIKTF
ncbi:MAG: ATP-binding protein [Candidatus Methanomethyliales bacterium]|nr:ATP-binding protein [Candidatus Methanomethylicales archaeon]